MPFKRSLSWLPIIWMNAKNTNNSHTWASGSIWYGFEDSDRLSMGSQPHAGLHSAVTIGPGRDAGREMTMKVRRNVKIIAMIVCGMLWTTPLWAVDMTVTVTNSTHGIYFTPLLVTAHDAATRIFEPGTAATAEAAAMAEGGDISGLLGLLGGADDDTVENPALGLLGPGESVTFNLNTDVSGNGFLSLAAMMLPTNDGFVGLNSLPIPTAAGTYTYDLNAYDAGTEANDELIVAGAGGVPGTPGIPAAPGGDNGINGTGVTAAETNTLVHIHRGSLGDSDPNGGISDLDNTIHRWLNPVAKLVIVVN